MDMLIKIIVFSISLMFEEIDLWVLFNPLLLSSILYGLPWWYHERGELKSVCPFYQCGGFMDLWYSKKGLRVLIKQSIGFLRCFFRGVLIILMLLWLIIWRRRVVLLVLGVLWKFDTLIKEFIPFRFLGVALCVKMNWVIIFS